ncbi:MAG: hypothetical protein IJN08_03750 [Clostridia bacterium]|nr:hypothetical protein [Clostridia bacterium]
MTQQSCETCDHFRQHYTLSGGKLLKVYCGHCTSFSSVKRKRPHDKACDSFIPAPSDMENFASKEYLTRTLLRRVLELPLLPEIQDAAGDAKDKDASQ